MRSYIFFILLCISTGIKAQTFTEVDPAITNFEGLASGTIAWGDYDNDNDLDILITGTRNYPSSDVATKIYRNKGDGTFENSGISLPGIYRGQAAWGDYDNDGDLDIVMAGLGPQPRCTIYRNKGDGTFEDSGIPLAGTYDSSVAWGDYDNDGYMDLLVTGLDSWGVSTSWIYHNNGNGTFQNSGIPLTGVRNLSTATAWVDYDNDGNLDLILTGLKNLPSAPISMIYHNKGDGTFEDSGIPLPGLSSSSVAWADYDNDGDQDLLIAGDTENPGTGYITRIYRNKGDGTFEDSGIPLPGLMYAVVAWGDYDNDGDQDIQLTGYSSSHSTSINMIYRNKGDGTFEDSGISLPAFGHLSTSWGDADNDGDLDILTAGYYYEGKGRLYINNAITPNTKPNAPTGLQAVLSADGKSATLSWQKATDAQTAQNTLSYNVYVSEKLSPAMADITTGYRRVAATGNAGQRTSYTVKGLKPGVKYYWSVQAVDAAYAGSDFATQQTFTPPPFKQLTGAQAPLMGLIDAAAWGDYDNDGDLDVVLNGYTGLANSACRLYRNKGDGTFEDTNIPLASSYNSSAGWVDYDNDGYLDLMLGGNNPTKLYHNKGDGTFEVNNNTAFPALNMGAFAWSDYDNDGDQDVFFVASTGGGLYRNKGDGTFENTGNTFLNIARAAAAWADYDNDGDPDIMITGQIGTTYFSKLYRNKGDGTFEDSGVSFTGMASLNSIAWGDYDNDGDLDLLMAGANSASSGLTRLYRNNGDGTFSNSGVPLQNVYTSALAWGDYDNDGYLDILLTGYRSPGHYARIYHNKKDGTFEELDYGIPGRYGGAVAWIDFDNDGDLDFYISGRLSNNTDVAHIYRNIMNTPNTKPLAPTTLQATNLADDQGALLTWQSPTDAETPQPGLNYNVYVSDVPGTIKVQAPMANISNGYRRISAIGNTVMNSDTIKGLLPGKTYYWSVQAIDAAYAGSPFAAERSFTTRSVQTISFANITATYGDADITPAAAATSSLPITFSSDNASVATIVGGKIRITGAGTANIKASQAGNTTFRPAADVTVTITVSKKMLMVKADNKTIVYGSALPTFTYTITGLVPGQTESVFTTPVSISGTGTDVGTYPITASNAAAANYDFTYQQGTLAITKKVLTVKADNKTITYGDALPTLTYTITGLVPGETESVFTTSVSTAGTGTSVGTYPVTASGAVATNYDFIYQPGTLTITKKMLTIKADDKTITYGDALPTLSYTITGLVTGETESVFTTSVSIAGSGTNVGTYPITASNAAAANYNFTYQPGTLTIQRATVNISFTGLPVKTYGDADFSINASIPNGLPITYSSGDNNVATIIGGSIHITGAGTTTIAAHQTGSGNYNPATDVPVTLTVNKKQLTVVAADKTITYGDALPPLTYNITGFIPGETESEFTIPVGITTDANGDAGVFNITVSGATADNYDLTYQQAHLTVQPATVQINFSPPIKTYGDADFNPGATISNGLPITYTSGDNNVATIVGGNIHITGAGTTTITAHQPGNSNYNAATDLPVTLTVSKKQLIVTAEDKTITYGDALPTFTYTITGFVPGETATAFTTPVSITGTGTNVGTYPVTVSNAAAANYDFTYQSGTLTIQKATTNISFPTLPLKTYGDADFSINATASNGLPVTYTSSDANIATIINGNIHITGAGTVAITAHQAGNNNYHPATDVPVTFNVSKKQLTITAEDKIITYGNPLPTFTYTIAGLVPGETAAMFTMPVSITGSGTTVGTYPITASNAAAANYDFTYQPGTLSIVKASSQIVFNGLPLKTYGDADFSINAIASNGLPLTYFSANGTVATIINGNIHITGAGSTLITAKQAGDNNYNAATDVSVILTVNKKRLTVTPADQTKIYGDPNPVFSCSVTGFVPGEDERVLTFPLYVTSTGVNAGIYPITASNAAAANYDFSYNQGTFTIYKAAQTITFNGLPVKTYGDANFSANATASSGLPITYTSSNANVATIVNGDIHIKGAGTVTITASQPGNSNYNAGASISQQLIVNKAAQTIQFAPMTAKTKGGPAFDPGARASSGLPITYVIENINIATVNGNSMLPIRAGFTKVTATQPGDNNYEPALPVEQELEVTTGGQLLVQDAVTPNGDGINDYLLIEGIRQYPDNQLYISNAQGKIVFEAKGYNNTNNVFRGFAGAGSTRLSRGVYYYVLLYQGKKQSGFFILEY